MTAAWLLSWWNLIFIVPFGLALLYLGLYTVTGLDGGHADGDAHADADADADADAHVHVDADADADAVADADGDADTDADHDADADHTVHDLPLHMAVLTFIGVGRAPVGLVLMILLLTWGCIGFITNNALRPFVPAEWMVALASLPMAAVGSVLTTNSMARLVARYLPSTETSAHKRRDLCGLVGEAMYAITPEFGMAVVRDRHGNRFQVACRVGEDRPPIGKGEPVLLVRFDEKDEAFTVVPYELDREPPALGRSMGTGTRKQLAADAPPTVRSTREPNARESS